MACDTFTLRLMTNKCKNVKWYRNDEICLENIDEDWRCKDDSKKKPLKITNKGETSERSKLEQGPEKLNKQLEMINECYKGREQNEEGERCKLREDKEIMEQSRVEWGKEDEKIKEQKKEN